MNEESVQQRVDPDFYDALVKSFESKGISPEAAGALTIIGIIIATLLLLWFLLYLKSRFKARKPTNIITDPVQIRRTLAAAFKARSPVEVGFYDEKKKRRATKASMFEIDEDTVTFELPHYITADASWIGKRMRFFFSAPSEKSKERMIFYSFVENLREVNKSERDFVLITTDMPDVLAVTQKRKQLRLTAVNRFTADFNLWPMGHEGKTAMLQKRTFLQKGELPPAGNQLFKLRDVSGGGIGVTARFSSPEERKHYAVKPGSEYFIYISLLEPDGESTSDFWLTGKVRHMRSIDGEIVFGLEFTYLDSDTDAKEPVFKPLDGKPVDEIADWVQVRHLALFREIGYW